MCGRYEGPWFLGLSDFKEGLIDKENYALITRRQANAIERGSFGTAPLLWPPIHVLPSAQSCIAYFCTLR